MGALLDKPLREKYRMRNVEVRKGDDVKIMRGKFAKKQGKVGIVDIKNTRIQIDGVQRTKSGGEKLETWFHPSNVKIILLDTSDNRRFKSSKKKTVENEIVKSKLSKKKDKKSLENKTVKKPVSKKPVKEKK
jgi:large subunit ribosomal protein L24